MRNLVFLVAVVAACNWTEFDNLADETWVHSTEKPDVKSSDYGIGIQRRVQGADATTGGKLGVLGTGTPTYSELSYSAAGESTFKAIPASISIDVQNILPQPLFIAKPDSNDIALVVKSTQGVLIAHGSTDISGEHQLFNATADPDAAVYMLAPLATPAYLPLVAVKNITFGASLGTTPPNQCTLTDSAGGPTLQVRALGTLRNGATDDVLMWADNGKLYRYASNLFNCTTTQAQAADSGATLTFKPEAGAQILTIDRTVPEIVLLQGHNGDSGFLQVINASTMMPVGGAVMLSQLRTAAILTVGAKKYVAAGAPRALVDGRPSGQVFIYEVSTSAGITGTAVAALHDAQPEDNQSFGRSVVAMPFNGKEVLAVAADNEIFVYFQTSFYDETRQGR